MCCSRDLKFGVEQNVDMVFASFVRNESDVKAVRDALGKKGKHIPIVSKVSMVCVHTYTHMYYTHTYIHTCVHTNIHNTCTNVYEICVSTSCVNNVPFAKSGHF